MPVRDSDRAPAGRHDPSQDPLAARAEAAPAPARLRGPVVTSLLGKAVELATLVLLATVVPRALGPADYGRFALALTIVTVASLALTLGGPALVTRFVPAAPPTERAALARALGLRLARGRGAQVAAIAAIAAVLAAAAPDRFPPLATALVVAALALNVVATVLLLVPLGLGRTAPWSARYPVQNLVLVAAVLWLHHAHGATGALAAIAVAALAGCALALATAGPALARGEGAGATIPPGALRFGALQAAGAALVQFTHRGGVLAAAALGASDAETGRAALAIGIALGASYAVLQTFTVSLPHLAAVEVTAPVDPLAPHPAEPALRRLAGGLLAVLVPAALLAAMALDAAVPAAFGPGYEAAVPAFGPALAVVVLAPLHALAVQVAALRLRPATALAGGAASATVFLAVALAAVPPWGAVGATAAALAGVGAGCAVSVRLLPGAAGPAVAGASSLGSAGVLAAALLA